jgi:hypothetical protein
VEVPLVAVLVVPLELEPPAPTETAEELLEDADPTLAPPEPLATALEPFEVDDPTLAPPEPLATALEPFEVDDPTLAPPEPVATALEPFEVDADPTLAPPLPTAELDGPALPWVDPPPLPEFGADSTDTSPLQAEAAAGTTIPPTSRKRRASAFRNERERSMKKSPWRFQHCARSKFSALFEHIRAGSYSAPAVPRCAVPRVRVAISDGPPGNVPPPVY